MSSGAAPLPTPETAPLSQGARVINTFFAPSKTFTDIRRSTSWWVPWLLVAIATLSFGIAVDKKIGWDQVIHSQISQSSKATAQFEQMPAAQREKTIAMQVAAARYMSFATPITVLIYFVILAAILLAIFNFGAGAEVKFANAMSIVAYASLPGLVSAALGIVSLVAGVNPEGFNVRNPVASNPAYFMDPNTGSKFLYGMASALDVFTIWTILLLGIGFSANSKLKRGTSIGIIVGVYLVYKLIASAAGTLM